MGRKLSDGSAGARLVALVARQHGVFSIAQAIEAGVSERQVRRRLGAGWLRRVHRGIYALAAGRLGWRGRWTAAVLACGPNAVLSHEHAAALWGLRALTDLPREIDVTVPEGERSRHPGNAVHRS